MIVSKALLERVEHVNPLLPDEAVEFGAAAAKAFAALGGVDAARRAEDDPSVRAGEVAAALARARASTTSTRATTPTRSPRPPRCARRPVGSRSPTPSPRCCSRDGDGRPFAAGARRRRPGRPRRPVRRVGASPRSPAPPTLARPAGAAARHPPRSVRGRPRGSATPRRPHRPAGTDRDVLFHLALTAASVLGTVRPGRGAGGGARQRAHPVRQAHRRVPGRAVPAGRLRRRRGRPARAHPLHALAPRRRTGADALADVLALRVHAIDVARSVLRTCQQLHGAAGVCDEYDISVLTRMVQPALRLPWSAERTATELAAAIQRDGFDGLFAHGGAPA